MSKLLKVWPCPKGLDSAQTPPSPLLLNRDRPQYKCMPPFPHILPPLFAEWTNQGATVGLLEGKVGRVPINSWRWQWEHLVLAQEGHGLGKQEQM